MKQTKLFVTLFLLVFVCALTGCKDTIPPNLTLLGEATVNVQCGALYKEPGYTVTDNGDSPHVSNVTVVITWVPVLKEPGKFTVVYTATDCAGNATTSERTVIYADTTPPVIVLPSTEPLYVEEGSQGSYDYMAGVTATDACDGDLTKNIVVITDEIDSLVAGQMGVVKYHVWDAATNDTMVSRRVLILYAGEVIPEPVTLSLAVPECRSGNPVLVQASHAGLFLVGYIQTPDHWLLKPGSDAKWFLTDENGSASWYYDQDGTLDGSTINFLVVAFDSEEAANASPDFMVNISDATGNAVGFSTATRPCSEPVVYTPELNLVSLPECATDDPIVVSVLTGDPAITYHAVMCIKVNGGWWTKPGQDGIVKIPMDAWENDNPAKVLYFSQAPGDNKTEEIGVALFADATDDPSLMLEGAVNLDAVLASVGLIDLVVYTRDCPLTEADIEVFMTPPCGVDQPLIGGVAGLNGVDPAFVVGWIQLEDGTFLRKDGENSPSFPTAVNGDWTWYFNQGAGDADTDLFVVAVFADQTTADASPSTGTTIVELTAGALDYASSARDCNVDPPTYDPTPTLVTMPACGTDSPITVRIDDANPEVTYYGLVVIYVNDGWTTKPGSTTVLIPFDQETTDGKPSKEFWFVQGAGDNTAERIAVFVFDAPTESSAMTLVNEPDLSAVSGYLSQAVFDRDCDITDPPYAGISWPTVSYASLPPAGSGGMMTGMVTLPLNAAEAMYSVASVSQSIDGMWRFANGITNPLANASWSVDLPNLAATDNNVITTLVADPALTSLPVCGPGGCAEMPWVPNTAAGTCTQRALANPHLADLVITPTADGVLITGKVALALGANPANYTVGLTYLSGSAWYVPGIQTLGATTQTGGGYEYHQFTYGVAATDLRQITLHILDADYPVPASGPFNSMPGFQGSVAYSWSYRVGK